MTAAVWVRPDEAAVWLRTTVANVHVLAHRRQWRRRGTGRSLRYLLDDVDAEARRRAEADSCELHPCKSS